MSFKEHVLWIVAEHERMEQMLKTALRENGTLREHLRTLGGTHEQDTSPKSTESGRGTAQATTSDVEERASRKLRGDWDAPAPIAPEPEQSLALQLPVPEDVKGGSANSGPGSRSERNLQAATAEEPMSPSKLTGNWDSFAASLAVEMNMPPDLGRGLQASKVQDRKLSANSSRSLSGGQEIDRTNGGTGSVNKDIILSHSRGRLGRESSLHTIDFGGAPPEVWVEWAEWGDDSTVPEQISSPSAVVRNPPIPRAQSMICGEAIREQSSCVQQLVVRPNSEYRATWDLLSMCVLSYDIISVPLEVFTFNNDEAEFTMGGMEWFTTVFWTLDIMASFLTGFHHEGLVEMRPSMIAHRYVRNGFVIDFIVVLVDWVLAIFTFNIKAVIRVGKTARVFRLLRMVRAMRLIRSFKLARLVMSLFTYIKSDLVRTLFSILLMLIVLCAFNHYIACGWYLIGTLSTNGWLQAHTTVLEMDDRSYMYMTSLHWSLTQFTPAGMEVHPHNFAERVYTVCVLLFALVTFSSFVSGITSGMMYLRKLKTEPAQQEAILRQYFQESRISAELGQRIWKFLQNNHFQHRKRVHRKDLDILQLVPEYLNNKLSEELYVPVVTWAPFLRHLSHAAPKLLEEVCHRAISEKCLTTREELFVENKVAECMSFITMGTMEYRHFDASLRATVNSGLWACEPVLWLNWVHCGCLWARTSCEIIQLHARTFRSILARDRWACDYASSYAKMFREYLLRNSIVWYTDIWCNTAELEELLSSWEDEHPHFGQAMPTRTSNWSSEQPVVNHSSSARPMRTFFQRMNPRLKRRSSSHVSSGSFQGSSHASSYGVGSRH